MIEQITSKEPKIEKHIDLHNAIEEIDNIVYKLDELIYRMEGPTEQDHCKAMEEKLPNFMDVLDGGAGAIREKILNAHKRIERLNELLF